MKHRVKIGSFLKRIKNTVDIEDATVYKRVTIKIRHQGILLRDTQKGSLIGTKKQFYVKDGQFLLSKIDARFGAFGIVPKEVDGGIITGNFWTYEVDKKKVNIDWFNLFTSSGSFYEICDRASSGTTHRKYLDEKAFLNFEIVLPNINEQNRFIEWYKDFYSKHNSLTQEINSQLSNIQLLRQAILQEAVQGKLVPQDPTDEPASELLKRIKAEKAKQAKKGKTETYEPITDVPYEIPKGWVWCRLGEIIETVNNGLYKPSSFYLDTGVISLRMYNIQNGKIDFTDSKRVILTDEELNVYKLEKNDILVNRVNSAELVGKSALLESLPSDLVYESMNMRMRLFFKEHLAPYINLYFQTKYYKEYLSTILKQAISQASINQTQLSRFLVAIPPIKEQKRIVAKVQHLMRLCDELEVQVQQSKADAEKLLQAVLREAFEGNKKYNTENAALSLAAEP